jgi:glycerophosphoryl diester phosphodiesterase
MARCPENTLASFRQAVADGADIIETDVRLTSDGAFVCIHDSTVDRTTDGSGPVREMSLATLRRLSAGGRKSEFREERIPTLQEYCETVPPHIRLAVELKADEFRNAETCRRLMDELRRLRAGERAIVLSFDQEKLDAIRTVEPEIELGFLSMIKPCPCNTFRLQGPHWPLLFVNPFYVIWAHRRRQLVCPLDPEPDRFLKLYLWMGCDAILSNDPGKTRKRLAQITESG